jgi:hypothetical protein
MNAQRLLKLLALVSIGATVAAIVQWQQTGAAPPSWLLRLSLGAFVAALVVGLIGEETRPRIMLRFLSAVAALVAAIALITDLSHAGGGFTSLAGHLTQFAPSVLASAKTGIMRMLGAAAWDPVMTTLLALPTFVIFAGVAVLCGYASRRRRVVTVFVN